MGNKAKILIVEDELTTQALLQQCLAKIYETKIAGTVKSAKEHFEKFKPNLILLDLSLPDGSGFDFFDFLKEDLKARHIPVIFLSLESDIKIKVKSFSAGAYDYITKPFNTSELMARIEAHFAHSLELRKALYQPDLFDDIFFDNEAKQVYRQGDKGRKVVLPLSPIEFKLLQCLMIHTGQLLSREQIAKEVWNKMHFQSRTIDRHISSLRKKMGSTGRHLKTVNQGGYLLSLENEVIHE